MNDKTFEWLPEWREHFEEHAIDPGNGTIEWDGLILDGWQEIEPADAE